MRWIALLIGICVFASGCAQTRTVNITATPADARIIIDGKNVGHGPIKQEFTFDSPADAHRIVVTRTGYLEHTELVTLETAKHDFNFVLKPQQLTINVMIKPAPATLTIDNKPVSPTPVNFYSTQLEFTVDEHNNWTTHTLSAERANYQPQHMTVAFSDPDHNYTIKLEPLVKDVSISSSPTGANVFIDDELAGTTPLNLSAHAFPVDIDSNEFVPQHLKVVKPGYDAVEQVMSWDEGKSSYDIELKPRVKTVRITTDPRDAIVRVEGQEVPRKGDGPATIELKFLPINDEGEPRVYAATATEKDSNGDWEPANFNIAWEEGKTDYTIHLKEIQSRLIQFVAPQWTHEGGAWSVEPKVSDVLAMKDLTDGTDHPLARRVTHLPKGTILDTFAISPDGERLLYTTLAGKTKSDFHSQMYLVKTDGSAGEDLLSDGKSLDLTPSFSPGGDQIVFASNRAGRRMSIWQMAATGAPGITQLSNGETCDLSPVVDSDPRPRVYYQSMIDSRNDPRLFSALLGNMFRTDMQISGMQPRVSPKNDAIAFTWINDQTGKRDIYKVPTGGGTPQNLTNSSDIDDFDPSWSADGSKIAFASDRGIDSEKRHNIDIWLLDLTKSQQPKQITVNGSQDDCPTWDPAGNAIYFRSNRGGQWDVWRITVK